VNGDHTVQVWDTATGRTLHTFSTGTELVDPFTSPIFSPDGHTVAAGGNNGTVWLWDTTTGQTRTVQNGYASGTVSALAFSPDGRILASGLEDGGVRLWHNTPDLSKVIRSTEPAPGASVSFRSHGSVLAIDYGAGDVRLMDMPTGRIQPASDTDPGNGDWARIPAPDTVTVALSSRRTHVEITDPATGELLLGLNSVLPFTALAVSPDGRTLATADTNNDGKVQLWDISTGMVRKSLAALGAMSIDFSPDGRTLATGSADDTVRIWNLDLPDPAQAIQQICAATGRPLTPQEIARYLPHGVSQPVCTTQS